MTYKTISNVYSRHNKLLSSLNDPYNTYSYGYTSIENFIPIVVKPGNRTKLTTKQESQAAIQQQIIYLHKKQEMEKEREEQIQTIKKLQFLKFLNNDNIQENNTENLILRLENKLNILNKLVNQDINDI